MSKSQISQKVMRKIAGYEQKNVTVWLVNLFFWILLLTAVGLLALWIIHSQLSILGSYELVGQFLEDSESVTAFIKEIPADALVWMTVMFGGLVFLLIWGINKWPILKNKIKTLTKILDGTIN